MTVRNLLSKGGAPAPSFAIAPEAGKAVSHLLFQIRCGRDTGSQADDGLFRIWRLLSF